MARQITRIDCSPMKVVQNHLFTSRIKLIPGALPYAAHYLHLNDIRAFVSLMRGFAKMWWLIHIIAFIGFLGTPSLLTFNKENFMNHQIIDLPNLFSSNLTQLDLIDHNPLFNLTWKNLWATFIKAPIKSIEGMSGWESWILKWEWEWVTSIPTI